MFIIYVSFSQLASPGLLSTLTAMSLMMFGTSMWWIMFGLASMAIVISKNGGIPFSTAW